MILVVVGAAAGLTYSAFCTDPMTDGPVLPPVVAAAATLAAGFLWWFRRGLRRFEAELLKPVPKRQPRRAT